MKKMTIEAMRNVNGGRWRCNYCGSVFWTRTGVEYHSMQDHHAASSWLPGWYGWGWERPFNISWCW